MYTFSINKVTFNTFKPIEAYLDENALFEYNLKMGKPVSVDCNDGEKLAIFYKVRIEPLTHISRSLWTEKNESDYDFYSDWSKECYGYRHRPPIKP